MSGGVAGEFRFWPLALPFLILLLSFLFLLSVFPSFLGWFADDDDWWRNRARPTSHSERGHIGSL